MIAPQADAEEEAIQLFDDLLGLIRPYLSNGRVGDAERGDRYFEKALEKTVE
jgi:hypothetical protein